MKKMNYPKTSIGLTNKTFARTIERYPLVVVACLPKMEYRFGNPLLGIDALAKKCEGKAIFGMLNVEQNKNIALHYDITTTPVILIFNNGRLVGYMKNDFTKKDIENRIKQFL